MRKAFFTATIAMVMMTGIAVAWEPVTYGDVRAQFEALDTGGAVFRSQQGVRHDDPTCGTLLQQHPADQALFDGLRYCEMDWHLVTIAFLVEPGSEGLLEETENTFIIDGVPTPAERRRPLRPWWPLRLSDFQPAPPGEHGASSTHRGPCRWGSTA